VCTSVLGSYTTSKGFSKVRNYQGSSGAAPTLARVGSVALQKGGAPLETHEHVLAAAASGALLGASLLGARFPRLVAWPLTATGALMGGLGVVRAARSALSTGAPRKEPGRAGTDRR
jgi:hypothetical protein